MAFHVEVNFNTDTKAEASAYKKCVKFLNHVRDLVRGMEYRKARVTENGHTSMIIGGGTLFDNKEGEDEATYRGQWINYNETRSDRGRQRGLYEPDGDEEEKEGDSASLSNILLERKSLQLQLDNIIPVPFINTLKYYVVWVTSDHMPTFLQHRNCKSMLVLVPVEHTLSTLNDFIFNKRCNGNSDKVCSLREGNSQFVIFPIVEFIDDVPKSKVQRIISKICELSPRRLFYTIPEYLPGGSNSKVTVAAAAVAAGAQNVRRFAGHSISLKTMLLQQYLRVSPDQTTIIHMDIDTDI